MKAVSILAALAYKRKLAQQFAIRRLLCRLCPYRPDIQALWLLHQLFMTALLDDPALIQHKDFAAEFAAAHMERTGTGNRLSPKGIENRLCLSR